ncbi:hypothetical protein ZWY2020_030701 [Hordeum vulgare]|nr:hypothetical protein ZWY2020_030701 [Hordeum vulgare]
MDSDRKKILRYKYNVANPNILWSRQQGGSPFWKSVTWALNATKTLYRWKIGNGDHISFWHDIWAGNCSLKVRFWNLFDICNQQDCTVSQVWNGTSLRLSFRRCVDNNGTDEWNNLTDFINFFCITNVHDTPIWELESNGIYSVRSFYRFINFGGVVSPFGDSLWKTLCPRNIHVFLWLCLYNKILTRDNVAKRKHLDDLTCLFCNEPESIQHIFFECINVDVIWTTIADFFHCSRMLCFHDVASLWKLNKKEKLLNMTIAASLWSVWTLRNEFCFQGRTWRGLGCILVKLRGILQQWSALCDAAQVTILKNFLAVLDRRREELLRIAWSRDRN